MNKKIIGICICMLFSISALPTIDSSATKLNDIDIYIAAGRFGLGIGFDIQVYVYKPENIPMTFFVNITHSSIIGGKIDRLSWNITCGEIEWLKTFEITPQALFNKVNITVETNTIFVAREGFSIGRLHILL